MARYIDADALIKKIYPVGIGDGKYGINAKFVKLAIDNAPTADVVPKSEVEVWKQNRFNLYQKLECYEMARQKVASEIFAEIETVFCYSEYPRVNANGTITTVRSHHWHIRPDDYNAIKKKYTEVE